MIKLIQRYRVHRYKIRAWKQYHRAVRQEGYYDSLGLGHPDQVIPPTFEDPRKLA